MCLILVKAPWRSLLFRFLWIFANITPSLLSSPLYSSVLQTKANLIMISHPLAVTSFSFVTKLDKYALANPFPRSHTHRSVQFNQVSAPPTSTDLPPKSEQYFLNARFRWFKTTKQNNKPIHIALLKCPSVVRKMLKSLACLTGICLPSLSSHTDFSELLTHQPFLMSLDVTCSYLCSWLDLLCIYTFAWTTPIYL